MIDRPSMFKITKTTEGGQTGSGSKITNKAHIIVCGGQEFSCDVVVETRNIVDGVYGSITVRVIEEPNSSKIKAEIV